MELSLQSLAVLAGRKMATTRRRADIRRALLIPPAGAGSLGDAAMVSASAAFLKKYHPSVDLLYSKQWDLDTIPARRLAAERYFYHGSAVQKAMLVSRLTDFSHVFFIGADVIDGAYNPRSVSGRLSLLAEAAKLGSKATLLGASYNRCPETTTVDLLRKLPQEVTLCARDPLSRRRMEETLDRPVRQVADLAFLLAERPGDEEAVRAINWIAAQRRAGNRVIGLNANYLHAEKHAGIPGALIVLMRRLLQSNLSIVMVPHDTRSERPDEKLLADAALGLPSACRDRLYMLPPKSPGVVKTVLKELDLLVSGRMHAAILAMSSDTPAYCFAYQDKFEGLFSFFDLLDADLLSTPDELAAHPARIAAVVLAHVENQQQLRARIRQHLPAVVRLAEQNFQ